MASVSRDPCRADALRPHRCRVPRKEAAVQPQSLHAMDFARGNEWKALKFGAKLSHGAKRCQRNCVRVPTTWSAVRPGFGTRFKAVGRL